MAPYARVAFISHKLQVCCQFVLSFLKRLELIFQVLHPITFDKQKVNEKKVLMKKTTKNRYNNCAIVLNLKYFELFNLFKCHWSSVWWHAPVIQLLWRQNFKMVTVLH